MNLTAWYVANYLLDAATAPIEALSPEWDLPVRLRAEPSDEEGLELAVNLAPVTLGASAVVIALLSAAEELGADRATLAENTRKRVADLTMPPL